MPTGPSNDHNRNSFTSLDVCAIIKACAESGVTTLSIGDFNLEFGKPTNSPPKEQANSWDLRATANPLEPDHAAINEKTLEEEVRLLREEQLQMAVVENPGLAEQLLMDGELEEYDDADTDDSDPDTGDD